MLEPEYSKYTLLSFIMGCTLIFATKFTFTPEKLKIMYLIIGALLIFCSLASILLGLLLVKIDEKKIKAIEQIKWKVNIVLHKKGLKMTDDIYTYNIKYVDSNYIFLKLNYLQKVKLFSNIDIEKEVNYILEKIEYHFKHNVVELDYKRLCEYSLEEIYENSIEFFCDEEGAYEALLNIYNETILLLKDSKSFGNSTILNENDLLDKEDLITLLIDNKNIKIIISKLYCAETMNALYFKIIEKILSEEFSKVRNIYL
ncbi:hypothetical protein KW95_04275 [Clostridioides difficile]|nr:hypothetical protein KW95_04275 [Clostridioides difficile]